MQPRPAPARERRAYFRSEVEIPATLFLQSSDDMRRSCTMLTLGGGGCSIYVASLEPLPVEATHQIRFELPNRPEAFYFDCQIVDLLADKEETGQTVHLAFVDPRPGSQDQVISYIQNRKRFERTAFRVAMPVTIEAQGGLRQFVPFKGTTVEAGRQYALCDMPKFGLVIGQPVVATFRGPKFRDEMFLQAEVTKVDHSHTNNGYRVQVTFIRANDKMLDFIRHHWAAKAKPVPYSE